jgi:hypothetical protein
VILVFPEGETTKYKIYRERVRIYFPEEETSPLQQLPAPPPRIMPPSQPQGGTQLQKSTYVYRVADLSRLASELAAGPMKDKKSREIKSMVETLATAKNPAEMAKLSRKLELPIDFVLPGSQAEPEWKVALPGLLPTLTWLYAHGKVPYFRASGHWPSSTSINDRISVWRGKIWLVGVVADLQGDISTLQVCTYCSATSFFPVRGTILTL